jgi:hypothetical protein
MTVIKVEQAERTASSGLSGRQPSLRLGPAAGSNSIANTSASSSTRSGQMATTKHWKSRRACCRFSLGIPSNARSYVSSKVVGNSFNALRILEGIHRRKVSSWQNAHRNLSGTTYQQQK